MATEPRAEPGVRMISPPGNLLELVHALQHHVASRIGERHLFEAVAPLDAGAGDGEGRHAVGDRPDNTLRVALLLGEEAAPVGDDEAEVAGAGMIDAGVVDLVEDAVAEREPHTAPRLYAEFGDDMGDWRRIVHFSTKE